MSIALIAAVAQNSTIGQDNGLVWREPLDQKHFRQRTLGCPVIMGRKTWESLPEKFRPLPGRRNVVVSRDPAASFAGAELANSLGTALDLVTTAPKVFVIGGAQLYALALPQADTLYLTELGFPLAGNILFPAWNRQDFVESERQPHLDAQGRPFDFVTYQRKAKG